MPVDRLLDPRQHLWSVFDHLAYLLHGGTHQQEGHSAPGQLDAMILKSAASIEGGDLLHTDHHHSLPATGLYHAKGGIHQCRSQQRSSMTGDHGQ
ncbi:MAG: hypothetical protein COB10_03635 [Planctomycetota bacterium]|nr:MAG: hypothetical protein COB10_03635 [Planctomycetota bacterium]